MADTGPALTIAEGGGGETRGRGLAGFGGGGSEGHRQGAAGGENPGAALLCVCMYVCMIT